jgi:hypothetical protein
MQELILGLATGARAKVKGNDASPGRSQAAKHNVNLGSMFYLAVHQATEDAKEA